MYDSRNLNFEASTIETIDKSVYNFVNSLRLMTRTNKGMRNVPVVWGTAERAFHAKSNKDIRDGQGMLVLPIISIRRTDFNKPRTSPGAFVGNVPENEDAQGSSVSMRRVIYQEKTMRFANADAFKLRSSKNFPSANPKIVYRTISIPMPVNVEVTYEITIRTEYQQQMNDLMTPFVTKTGTVSYVQLTEGEHHYEGFIQDAYTSSDNVSDYSSDERKFETKVGLKVVGYLVGEGINRDKPHFAVRENAVEVRIPRERRMLGEIPEHEFGAYYGLEGVPNLPYSAFPVVPFHFSNVPAASFFSGGSSSGGSGGNVSENVVTKTNFNTVMSDIYQINEVIKAEDDDSGNLTDFVVAGTILPNSEQVFLNGILQAQGAAEDYTVINNNTIRFGLPVDPEDLVTITYIKN